MEDSILMKNLESIITIPPTYMKALHLDPMEKVELVFIQKDVEENSFSKRDKSVSVLGDCDINTGLDVTGSPLEVDLCGDETFIDIRSGTIEHCSDEETKQLPVDIMLARYYLNQRLKTKQFDDIPVFVLCDGNNSQKTVLIGVHRTNKWFSTCSLSIVGLHPKDHEKISLEAMRKRHITSAGFVDLKIDYLVHFEYYIYGTPLRNVQNVQSAECSGCIRIDLSTNENCDIELPRNMKKMKKKMILQVVVGHKLSLVNFLWEDICLLQSYVQILSNIDERNEGESILSANPTPLSEILKSVKEIVSSMTLLRRQTKRVFDLKNIRTENILDKLWNILKHCENDIILKNAFHYFFEELAACGSNIKIPEGNSSNISTVVNGILDGKLAVPTVTHYQAIEFLFEIGAEKLKNDYRSIVRQFYITDSAISDSAISVKWRKLHEKLLIGYSKGDRTHAAMHERMKLSYLKKLHVAVEIIYLVKDHLVVPQETFDDFCKCVYMHYVEREDTITSSELQIENLHEFAIHIDAINESAINIELPISWTMQMKSTVEKSEITTVHHLSKYPILPTTIYDKDVSESND